MFKNLRASMLISKVEAVIDTRLTSLPALFQKGLAGLAHTIVLNQRDHDSFVFSAVVDHKRLDPRIASLHSILTFMTMHVKDRQIIVNGEDCYGSLKIVCLGLLKEMQSFTVDPIDMAFIELKTGSMIRQHLPELFNEND